MRKIRETTLYRRDRRRVGRSRPDCVDAVKETVDWLAGDSPNFIVMFFRNLHAGDFALDRYCGRMLSLRQNHLHDWVVFFRCLQYLQGAR